jgi:phage terminase large subunit-like protein
MPRAELERFCTFCSRFLTDERGRPFTIEEFQRRILADVFDGCRETVVVIGKKSGKSSLVGAVAVYHVLTRPDAECVIVASSRDQAGIILKQVQGFVRRSEALRGRLQVVQREVRHAAAGGRIRVLASDVDTLDGVISSLALVDELARTKTEEAYGLLRDSLGPRQGQLVAISTAGDDEESPLGRLRAKAHAMPGFARAGAYKHVRAAGFAWHEWSLDPGDDINDLELLKSANPATWIDEAELRARRDSPSTQPWQLARFTAGLWVSGSEESAISAKEWAACADPSATIPDGAKDVTVGVDLGWRWDTTAFVPAWRPAGAHRPVPFIGFTDGEGMCTYPGCAAWTQDSSWRCEQHRGVEPPERAPGDELVIVGEPTILTPPQDGTSLDSEDVFAVAEMYARLYPDCTIVLDPEAGGEQLGQRIERELADVEVVTFSQKTTPMCAASQRLAEDIAAAKLRHPDHDELNRHVLNAAAKFIGPQWRFVKPRGKRLPIDGCIALAMANDVIGSREPRARSVYETRGAFFA